MAIKLKPFNFIEWLQKDKCDLYIEFKVTYGNNPTIAKKVNNLVFYNEILSFPTYCISDAVFCAIRDYDSGPGLALWDIRGQYTDDLGYNLMMEDN